MLEEYRESDLSKLRGKIEESELYDHDTEVAIRELKVLLEYLYGDSQLQHLEGVSILDLGCGSPNAMGESRQPRFSQICAANGANVIGVDIEEADCYNYRHIQADLIAVLEKKELDILVEGAKFDIIAICQLFDSPALNEALNYETTQFEKDLMQQSSQLLNPNGVILTTDFTRDPFLQLHQNTPDGLLDVTDKT